MRPRVALLPWGDTIEDFLDTIGLTLEDLTERYTGGWLFGYVEALAAADVDTVIVCVSRQVSRPERRRHAPTGAELLLLPQTRAHRLLRRSLADPYAWSVAQAARRGDRLGRLRARVALQLGPYAATPVGPLVRELRERRPAAIVCQEYEYARYDACVLAGRRLGIPVFATFQGGDRSRPGLESAVRSRAMAEGAGFVVGSGAEAERIRRDRGVPAERIARVPNPLDTTRAAAGSRERERRALGFAEDTVVVAWHGRVEVQRKGIDVLLDAWRTVRERPDLPERRLLMIGTGPDADAVRDRLDAGAGVTWIDRYLVDRERIAALLAAADLYAFPSRHEGFAVAPMEAMAAGLPVVAADAPGVAEMLPPGSASGGVIVPRGDPAALATELGALIADAPRRAELGRLAREHVERAFSPEAVGRDLRRVFLRER